MSPKIEPEKLSVKRMITERFIQKLNQNYIFSIHKLYFTYNLVNRS